MRSLLPRSFGSADCQPASADERAHRAPRKTKAHHYFRYTDGVDLRAMGSRRPHRRLATIRSQPLSRRRGRIFFADRRLQRGVEIGPQIFDVFKAHGYPQ